MKQQRHTTFCGALFNLYSEEVFKEALENYENGMKNGERLNNIRYTEYTVIFVENTEDLQQLMDKMNAVTER